MKLGLFDTQSLIGFSIINSPSKAGEQAAQWMKAEHIGYSSHEPKTMMDFVRLQNSMSEPEQLAPAIDIDE